MCDTLVATNSIFLAMASEWAESCCLCSERALLTSLRMLVHRVSVFWLLASSSDAKLVTLLCSQAFARSPFAISDAWLTQMQVLKHLGCSAVHDCW